MCKNSDRSDTGYILRKKIMKISKKGQNALISVVDLALHSADNHQSINDVAQRECIDPRYLGQIFFALKK